MRGHVATGFSPGYAERVGLSLLQNDNAKVIIAGALVLACTIGIGRFAYTPMLPAMIDHLGWTMTQAGDAAAANFGGYLVGALLAARLAAGPHGSRWLMIGLLLSVSTTVLGATVTGFNEWLMLRAVAGFGSALALVLVSAIVAEAITRSQAAPDRQTERPFAMDHFSGVGIGILVSVGIVYLPFASAQSARPLQPWVTLGLVAAVMALIAMWWLRPREVATLNAPSPPTPVGAGSSSVSAPLPRSVALWRLILAYGLFGFGYVVTATFIATIAAEIDIGAANAATSLDLAPEPTATGNATQAWAWLVVGLAALPSVPIWLRIRRWIGTFPALQLAFLLEAGGVILTGFATGIWPLLLGAALLGGTFVAITALGLDAARMLVLAGKQTAPARGAAVIAWMTVAFSIGQWLGPAVAGRLADISQGFAAPSLVAAQLLLIGVVLLHTGLMPQRH